MGTLDPLHFDGFSDTFRVGAYTMCTITLELPDELVDKARQKGLLSSTAIELYLRNLLDEARSDAEYPPGY